MNLSLTGTFVGVTLVAGAWAWPAVAAESEAACPGEVAQASVMVAKAREAIRGASQANPPTARTPSGDPGSGAGRSLQGEPGALAGRTPLLDQGTGTARGLATSPGSDASPWSPSPGDKTLKARTAKARKLTAQARSLCRAGKMDEAKGKAAEAMAILGER